MRRRQRERERIYRDTKEKLEFLYLWRRTKEYISFSIPDVIHCKTYREKARERERERERVRVRAHINKWKVDNQTTKVLRASQQLWHNLCHFIVLKIYFIILPYHFTISHLSDVL